MAPLCPCVNYASESGYYKNIYFKKVFDALHTNHVKWSYKFVALLELDLPYNGEACETKSMPPTQNLQVKNFFMPYK